MISTQNANLNAIKPSRLIHTADADTTQLSSYVASASTSAVWTHFATSSRRLPTDSVDNLETDHTDSIAVWVRERWSSLITLATTTSLCRHLSPTSIAEQDTGPQEIVNWVTTADGCVHIADATQLDSWVASASAVCIGHKLIFNSSHARWFISSIKLSPNSQSLTT